MVEVKLWRALEILTKSILTFSNLIHTKSYSLHLATMTDLKEKNRKQNEDLSFFLGTIRP